MALGSKEVKEPAPWRTIQRLLFDRKLQQLIKQREIDSEETTAYVKYIWNYAWKQRRKLPGDNRNDRNKTDDISNVSKYIRGETPLPKKDLPFWFTFFDNKELELMYRDYRFGQKVEASANELVEKLRLQHGIVLSQSGREAGAAQQRQVFDALKALGVPHVSSFAPGQNAHFGGRIDTSILVEFFDDVSGVHPSAINCELGASPPLLPSLLKKAFDGLNDEDDDHQKCFVQALHFKPLDSRERYRAVFGTTTYRLARAWRKLRTDNPSFASDYYDREIGSLLDFGKLPMLASIDTIPETSDEKLYLSLRSEWADEAPNHIHAYGETIEPKDLDIKRNRLDLEPALDRLLFEELGLRDRPQVVHQAQKAVFGLNVNLVMPSLQFFSSVKFGVSADEIAEGLHRRDKETRRPELLDFKDPQPALDLVVDGWWTGSAPDRLSAPVYLPCRMLLLHLTRMKFSDQAVLRHLQSRLARGQLSKQPTS